MNHAVHVISVPDGPEHQHSESHMEKILPVDVALFLYECLEGATLHALSMHSKFLIASEAIFSTPAETW